MSESMNQSTADAVALNLAQRLLNGTHFVIVSQEEATDLIELKKQQRPWNLVEFAEWTGHSPRWVKENIFYVPQFKAQLDQASGGWVKYSTGNGSPWVIPIEQTKRFVLDNGLLNR